MEENKLHACEKYFANVFQNFLSLSHLPLPPLQGTRLCDVGKCINMYVCIILVYIHRCVYESVLYIDLYR